MIKCKKIIKWKQIFIFNDLKQKLHVHNILKYILNFYWYNSFNNNNNLSMYFYK